MTKEYIIDRIDEGKYTPEQLKGWVGALPGKKGGAIRPNEVRVGDVFIHDIFSHPYILLEKHDEGWWLCGLLTTDSACEEIYCSSRSRFFADSYFTRVLLSVKEHTGAFYGVYDNNRHLKTVTEGLKNLMCCNEK